jgi:hypothetical protein
MRLYVFKESAGENPLVNVMGLTSMASGCVRRGSLGPDCSPLPGIVASRDGGNEEQR